MRRYECGLCGLTAADLPDGVDPEYVFEVSADGTRCEGCAT